MEGLHQAYSSWTSLEHYFHTYTHYGAEDKGFWLLILIVRVFVFVLTRRFLGKTIMESLLSYGHHTSCWVQEELRSRVQPPVGLTEVEDAEFWVGKKQSMARGLRYKAEEPELLMDSRNNHRKESGETVVSYQEGGCESLRFVALLKACARQKDLLKGARVHAGIVKSGSFEKDAFVSNTLVNMYVKCGALTKGQKIFDDLPVRNLVSWTALVAGYAEYGHGQEALDCFKLMQHEGLSPDAVSFACILKACGSIGATEKGQDIHAQIIKVGLFEQHVLVGTALVDMYAKCGVLGKAQEVFDELPVRNVVSWNALITGYAQQGHSEEALSHFERMQGEGLSPDVVTFSCILKACGSLGASDKGLEIHTQIVGDACLEKDIIVGTGLVDMYAKCGLLGSAQEVFDELSVRNIVSWNALIAGHVQHGHGEEAWNYFERMQLDEGVSPDAVTFACILKACGSIGVLDQGQDIHAQVVKNGLLGRDVVVGTALVDMYAKCGALEKAQEVFDELPLRNVVSWNALIAGYAHYGHGQKALNCYEPMLFGGLSPSAATCACIMKACGSLGALDKGQKIHAKVVKEGFLVKDVVVANALMDMYAKCGTFAKAQEVFDELPSRNEVSWAVLIAGYARHGYGEEALKCLERMLSEGLSPDATIYACILKVCGSFRAADKGQQIHSQILSDKLLWEDIDFAVALVEMYANCGLFERAHEVFEELQDQNVASWNALIGGYVLHGHGQKALECFKQMQCRGLSPDATTFVCILKACGSIRALDRGDEICIQIVREGLLGKDALITNAVIEMYVKCGALSKAQEVFDELPVRNVVLWTVLMEGYIQHGHGEETLNCFQQMQREGLFPDAVAFLSILQACGMMGAAYKGLELHADITKDGLFREDIVVGSAIVNMYVKCGMLEEAQEVFDDLPIRDIVTWNALIAGYVQVGEDQVVFNLLDKMIGEGKEPDIVTFTILLNTCSHRGLLNKGQIIFESMKADYGITPTAEHHICIIDLLCRAGLLDKVIAVIKEMPCFANLTVWHIVMSACQRLGNMKLGSWAFEQALQLDEKNAAVFVCMGNLYAEL